ncbi:MAG: PilZ domain-containing protein [Bellilinea sp.]
MFTHPTYALQAVKSLAFQRIPIAVTGTYKGLFFEEKVAPLKVGPDYVVFRAPKSPMHRTLRDKVILHSHVLPQSVRTDLQSIDAIRSEITLTNFSFTGVYWRDRREQRIEPPAPLQASITFGKKPYRANLNNLSLHGAGLMVYFGDDECRDLAVKKPVEVSFHLGSQSVIHISGSVASIRQMDYTLAQLGIRLEPTSNQESWLENYIAKRKIEILNELDHPSIHPNQVQL